MIMPRQEIEKAVAEERGHDLRCVYLDVNGGRMLAANGFILAEVPVDIGQDDVSGQITPEAAVMIRHEGGVASAVEKKVVVSGWGEMLRPDTQFPVDELDKVLECKGHSFGPVFTVDATLLKRLAEAITQQHGEWGYLRVYLPDRPDSPIYVEAADSGGGRGVIMPLEVGRLATDKAGTSIEQLTKQRAFYVALRRLRDVLREDGEICDDLRAMLKEALA